MVGAALMALLTALPGIADPSNTPQVPLDDVVRSLGIASSPVDYVITVDTSGSMQDSDLYPKVKTALGFFFQALKSTDHLSLLTFDTAATLRYTGAVGSDPQAALNQLPPTATGKGTDIGAGIEAGIAELERPHANTVGAIVLMTDGKIQAPPGSVYSTPSAPAWNTLRDRARIIAAKHHIASYALALEPITDAALLKNLFPDTLAVALPSDQIDDYLDRVNANSMRQKAIQALQPDLGNGIQASVSGPFNSLNIGKGTAVGQVTLHSTFAKVPVRITDLSANVTGDLQATASRLPASIDLKPGESITFRLQLTFPSTGEFRLGDHPVTRTGKITFAGIISSPWQQAITSDLALTFAPRLTTTSVDLTGHSMTGWSWFSLGLFLVALVLFILLILIVRHSRMPRLVGTLELWHEGQHASEFSLGGKVLKLGKGPRHVPGQALGGSVRGLRRRDEYDGVLHAGVSIQAKSGRARRRGRLFDGESLEVGDIAITYRR
jgi:hypothetical protein